MLVQNIRSLGYDLRRYATIMVAMLQREEALRRQAPIAAILEMLEPLFLIGVFTAARLLVDGYTPSLLGGNILLFYATGFFPKYYFMYISIRRMNGSTGASHRRFPIEQRLDYILVHIVTKLVDFTILGIVVFGAMYYFGGIKEALPYNISLVFAAVGYVTMLGFGWGMVNIVLVRLIPIWLHLAPAINLTLIALSGALFVAEFLPPNIRYYLSFNPEVHAIGLFKMGFYPHYPTTIVDLNYLTWWSVGFVAFGLAVERVTRRSEI